MLVGEGGRVDAQVIEESEDVLSTMRPRLLEMNLGDEDAWEIGLTCGGTIEVFVEPLALDGSPDVGARMYEHVREHARSLRGAVPRIGARLRGSHRAAVPAARGRRRSRRHAAHLAGAGPRLPHR